MSSFEFELYNDKTELSFWFPTGTGYHLVIDKSENCKVGQVTQLVRELIPGAKLEKEVTTELSSCPTTSRRTSLLCSADWRSGKTSWVLPTLERKPRPWRKFFSGKRVVVIVFHVLEYERRLSQTEQVRTTPFGQIVSTVSIIHY